MPSSLPDIPFLPQSLQKLWARQVHQAYLLLCWALLQLLHLAIALEARTMRWKDDLQKAWSPRMAWLAKVLPWPLCLPFAWLLPEPAPRSGKAPGPPQTIAIVLAETSPALMPLPRVADLVGWCASMGLTHITIYDPEGHTRSAQGRLTALLEDPESFTCGAYSYHIEAGYLAGNAAEEGRGFGAAVEPAQLRAGEKAAAPEHGRARPARAIQIRLLSGRDSHALLLAAARKGAPPHCAPWPGHSAWQAATPRGRAPKPALQQQQQLSSGAGQTPRSAAQGPDVAVMSPPSGGSAPDTQPSPFAEASGGTSGASPAGPAQRSRLAVSSTAAGDEAAPGGAEANGNGAAQPQEGPHAELPGTTQPEPSRAQQQQEASPEAGGRGVAPLEEGTRRRSVSSLDGGGPIRRARARRGTPRGGGGGGAHGGEPHKPRVAEDDFEAFVRAARQGLRADCAGVGTVGEEPNQAAAAAAAGAPERGRGGWSIPAGNGAADGPPSSALALAPAVNGAVARPLLSTRSAQGLEAAGSGMHAANGMHAGGGPLSSRQAQSLDSAIVVARPRSAVVLSGRGGGGGNARGRGVSWAKEGRLFSMQSELSADSLLSAFNSQLAAQGVSAPTPPLTPRELAAQMAAIAGAAAVAEPELVLVFGRACTLAGFPPWPLRFAEIYHMGCLAEATPQGLLDALQRYCRTPQRFGT